MGSGFRFKGPGGLETGLAGMLERMGKSSAGDSAWTPAVDIFETPDEVVIVADLAGVNREDVRVIIDENVVRIYGRREPTCCSGQGARFHRMEIASGSFVRSFRISVPFDAQGVKANAEDGLLTVSLPKKTEEKRDIPITRG